MRTGRASGQLRAILRSAKLWNASRNCPRKWVLGEGVAQEIPAFQLEEGEIAGYRAWDFHNTQDGRQLTAFIVCGRPSPISLHTPDWCYGGAGYQVQGSIEPLQVEISGSGHQPSATFNTAYFRKPNELVPSGLRILWSWNAGEGWEVPRQPRYQYASREVLYKLYVVAQCGGESLSERSRGFSRHTQGVSYSCFFQ